MKYYLPLFAVSLLLLIVPAFAQLANIKVVTDANPDYSDMKSMVRSINHNWTTDAEKMWAQFYWDHIARRQTEPMNIHGFDLTDPIRQYNDYGFLMCSTISGLKCSVWNYMGYPCRYWDIGLHTVPDVWFDGRFHHYDNSLSVIYTLEDGKTIAGVPDVGRIGKGPETDGKEVQGYIAMYKSLNATGPNGYLEGSDTNRALSKMAECFNPNILKYRFYYYDQDRGHRYSLNLRSGEVYTRYYSRQDVDSPNAVVQNEQNANFKADPAYFIPNKGKDPESVNPRYRIRGNGERTWVPPLTEDGFAESVYHSENLKGSADGLVLIDAAEPGYAIFKVEGANVITSLNIKAQVAGGTPLLFISTDNGIWWEHIDRDINDIKLIEEVNGSYEVLVYVILRRGASLQSIAFNTVTQINSKTQPQLKIGKNTVYVGNGEQTGTIVLWPQLHGDDYELYVFEEQNIVSQENNPGYMGSLHADDGSKEGFVVFRIDSPTDLTSVTYGGRFYNRAQRSHIDLLHSFDEGETWTKTYSLTDTNPPWDVIHYETVTDIPEGTYSVLFKYSLNTSGSEGSKGGPNLCSIFAVRMEANNKLAAPSTSPVEVTFDWSERQEDYSLVKRSHTQLVESLPATYTINVGGADHPVVDALTVNLKGSRPNVKYGYSDDQDVGGEKWVGVWATYGKNLAAHKPYTVSTPPLPAEQSWGANDDSGKRLTDTFVGSPYNGGSNYRDGVMWRTPVDITVDLEEAQACKAFRIHLFGYDWQDAVKGQITDKVEVLTSLDGQNFVSAGHFDFNLRWKDVPENYMWTDEETFCAHVHMLPLKDAVNARYVRFSLTPGRTTGISEVMVLDDYDFTPFDMRIALPDPSENGKAPPNAGVSPNVRQWGADEKLPQSIGKAWTVGGDNVDD